MAKSDDVDGEVIQPPGSLAALVEGAGDIEIDAEALARAEAAVEALKANYEDWVHDDIGALKEAYDDAVANPSVRGEKAKQIDGIAHDIKGQGSSFGYPLMSAIGGSLSEFCRNISRLEVAQLDVIRAHIDAMTSVIDNRLKGNGGTLGVELIGLLQDAVEKRRI